MKNALLRGLAVFALSLIAFAAFAGDDPALLSGFRRESLEVYLSRADAEKDRDSWLKLAGLGESAALADWERAAAHLYDSSEARDRARAAVGAEVANMTQERYRSWLVRRFLEASSPQSGYDALRRAVDEANYSLLYERETDGSGRVKRDSQLDPVLKGSADLESDKNTWETLVGASLESSVDAWQGRVDAASSELLREFGGGAELAAASEELARAAGARREGYRRELMALFTLEEGRFVSLRSYDSYSLKNKSSDAAALAVTDRLIRETKGSVDGAIVRIRDGLAAEAARPETSTDVETQEWLASFKRTFESGLAKWDSAEESFLAERVEWERNAGADYRSGEEAWATAYRRLQGERMAWEAAVRLELDKGRNEWGAKRAELAAAIDRAQKDFTTESAERKTAADARVSAIVDLYTQSASMVGTASSSGKYWTEKLAGCSGFDTAAYKSWFSTRLSGYTTKLGSVKTAVNAEITSLETELKAARADLEEVLANISKKSSTISAPVKYYTTEVRHRQPGKGPRDEGDGDNGPGDTYTVQVPTYWDLAEYLAYRRDTANATIARLEKDLAESNADAARLASLMPEIAEIARLAEITAAGKAILVTDSAMPRIDEAIGEIFGRDAIPEEKALWEAYREGSYWLDQKVHYGETLELAQASLKACLAETLSDSGALPTLQSVLGKNGDVEGLYLDEYQIELLRAEALKAFWEKRLAIAVAVKTYADQKTSDRPTEASQRDAYAAALAVYGEKKAAYDGLVKSLSSLGAGLGSSRASLDAAQKRLAEASSALAKAESDFSSLLALYDIGSDSYFKERISTAFRSLEDSASMEEGKSGLYDAMLSYIEAGRRYGFQEEIRAGRRSLEELVNGRANLANPAASIPSVAGLEKAVRDAKAALESNPRPANASEAGLSLDDPYLPLLNELFLSMKDATGDERAYGEANVRLLLGKRLEALVADLEERKSAILLLSSRSDSSWLDAEGVADCPGGVEARLASASKAARLAELGERAELEKKMLDRARYLGKNPSASYDFSDGVDVGAWAILHLSAAGGAVARMSDAEIEKRSSLLGSLRSRIDGGAGEAELAAWVKSLGDPASRSLLDGFLSGRGAAQGASGLDLAALASVRGESDRLTRLASVYDAQGAVTPGGIALRREAAMAAAGRTLAALGVGKATAGGLELSSADNVTARIDAMGALELAEWAVRVDAAMRRGAPGLGSSESEELVAYYGRLLDYAGLSASRRGYSYSDAEAKAAAARSELAAASKVAEDLSFALGETGSDSRLAAVVSVLAWSDGAGSGVRLGEAERNSLESTFRKNAGVLVARAMGDLVSSGKADSDATWELAMGQALASIAPGGLASARKAAVLAEARRLRALDAELASGTATSAEGRRLLAYASWRDFDGWLDSSAASLPVASADAASLAKVYGQFIAAFPDGLSAADTDANKASLEAIAKYIDEALPSSDRTRAKEFLDKLATEPPATAAALALSWLCPKLDASDHDGFAARSGGALFERALSLALASSLSGPDARSVFSMIQGLSGLDSHGAIEDTDFGPSSLASLRERSLSGLDAASMGDEARAFYAMGRALAGEAVDPAALGLGSGTEKLLVDFLAVLDAKRGYVPSLSGSASEYAAANAAASGISAPELEAALSSGIWLSPFFLAPSSDPTSPGYLALYSGLAEAELASAANLACDAANGRVAVLGEEANLARARLSFALSVNAAAARLSADSYRAYNLTEDKSAADTALVVTKTVRADSDTERYGSKDAGLNALIEAATELDHAGRFLLAACASLGTSESAARQEAIDTFLASAASYLGGATWRAADSADSETARAASTSAQGELDLAGRKLSSLSSAAAGARADILKFGSALAGFDPTARKARLAALRAAVDSAKSESLEAETAVRDASADFASSIDDYNAAYAASRSAYDELETARWDLALKDEVLEYAQNGYLRPDDSGDYRGPAAQLAYVQDRNARAGAALDILKSLYSSSDTERTATEDRYVAYREKYRQYLEMRKFQGDLFGAIARQEQTVQTREAAYRAELVKIFAHTYPNPFTDGATGAPLTARVDESSGDLNWSNYLRADPSGYGLALNLDGARLVKTSDEAWAAAKKDFEGIADSERNLSQAQLNAEKWSSDMAAYALRLGESAFRSRLDDWSRALTYLRLIASEAEDSATNPFCKLTSDGDATRYLNGNADLSGVSTPGGPLNDTFNSAQASSRALAKAAYERITQSGNEEERKLWDYAVAMRLTGSAGKDPFDFLDYTSRLDTFQQLGSSLESSAKSCDKQQKDCLIAAAVNVGIAAGFAAFLCWPAAAMYAAEAVLLSGFALDAHIKANEYRSVISTNVSPTISNLSGFSVGSKTSLVGDLQSLGTARASLDKERAVLAALKGKSDSPITDSATVLASIEKAYSLLGKGSPSAEIKDLITSRMGMIGTVYTSADVVSRTVALLADERNSEQGKADSQSADDAAALRLADEAYRTALAAYQAGTGSEADLRAKAAAAFKNPSYTFLSQQKGDIAFQLEGILASPVTDNESYEEERANSAQAVGEAIKALYAKRLQGEASARAVEWADRQNELAQREAEWNARINASVKSGIAEWNDGTNRLQASFEGWKAAYTTEYQSRTATWKDAYLDFQERKKTWTEKVAEKAGQASTAATFGDIAASADYEARVTNTELLAGLSLAKPDPDAELDKALNRATLARILEASAKSNERIGDIAYSFRSGIKASAAGLSARDAARQLVAERSGEMAKHAAKIVARQARDNVEAAKASYEKSVEDANDSFVDGLSDQFGLQAYTSLGGGGWTREAIIGSTLISGVITERQNLAAYERYRTQIRTTTSLDEGTLESYDAAGVEMLVEKAMKELDGERVRVFGDGTEKPVIETTVYDSTYTDPDAPADERNFLEKAWDKVVKTFSAADTSANRDVKIMLGNGEFTAHIGYAPVLKQVINPDESYASNVLVSGSGQLGRIMGYFEYYQARQGKGYSEVKKPMYDKRIWNDEGSFVKSPTIKSTVNMGVSIAAMGLGPWAAMAVNLADDAVFTAMDVAGGYKSGDQALFDFGKQAVSSIASTAIGGAFGLNDALGKASGFLGAAKNSGFVAKALIGGAQNFISTASSSAINAFELGKDGSLSWNDNAFLEGTLGKSAMSGYLSGMASSFTSGALAEWNLKDANGIGLSENVFNTDSIQSFNGLAGSLVGQGVGYAMTGDATFNLANFNMFGIKDTKGNVISSGLLEMHVGGSGFSMNLGAGGADISYGKLASSWSGFVDTAKIAGAYTSSVLGDTSRLSIFNAVNGLGYMNDVSNSTLGKDIWNGKRQVGFEAVDGGLGYQEGNRIVISNMLDGKGKENAAQLAALIAHEGDHQDGMGEASAYIREIKGFSDLQNAWGIDGQGLASGIGEMANYFRDNGEEATLHILDAQGSLDVAEGRQFTDYLVDPKVVSEIQSRVEGRYGSNKDAIAAIVKSELVRQRYLDNKPIWKKQLGQFTDGEGIRLGMEAGFRSQVLQAYADSRRSLDSLGDSFSALTVEKKAELRRLGIDVDAMKGNGTLPIFVEALKGTLLNVTLPAYTDYMVGELAGKAKLPSGLVAFTTTALIDLARTGHISTGNALLEMAEEKSLDAAIKKTFGTDSLVTDSLKGFEPSQIASVLGLLKTDFKAALDSVAYARSVTGLYGQYVDASSSAQIAKRGVDSPMPYFVKKSATEMAAYAQAQDYISGNTQNFDVKLMAFLHGIVGPTGKTADQAYKDNGYTAGFVQGTKYDNQLLRTILFSTQDDLIMKNYRLESVSPEWYAGKLYISSRSYGDWSRLWKY